LSKLSTNNAFFGQKLRYISSDKRGLRSIRSKKEMQNLC